MNVTNCEFSVYIPDSIKNHGRFCALRSGDQTDTPLKFPVRRKQCDAKKIFPPWQNFVLSIMPTLRTLIQGIIITFLMFVQ